MIIQIIIFIKEIIYIFNNKFKKMNETINFLTQNDKSNFLKNNFKTLKYHSKYITYLSKLNDGRLASCSGDQRFNIYKKDSFELQLSFQINSSYINSFTQLNDGKIIICSGDKTMKIIELIDDNNYKIKQILIGHTKDIMKVIEINKNKLISISCDNTLKIWILNKKNKFDCILNIIYQSNYSLYCNILKLNNKEFITLSGSNNNIKFWNLNNYSYITTINNIITFTDFCENICLLEKDLLCIGGCNSKGFYLIKISTHQLIKNIIVESKRIFSIFKCFDGLFLCSIEDQNGNNCIVKYKYEELNLYKIFEKIKAHEQWIYSCIELNNGIIASGGVDSVIKLWKD